MTEFRTLSEEELEKIYKIRDAFIKAHSKILRIPFFLPSQKKFSNAVMRSLLNNEGATIVAEYSRQSGKTTTIVATVCFLALSFFEIADHYGLPHTGFLNIGIFAPQQQQSKTDFERIRDFLDGAREYDYGFEASQFNSDTITLKWKDKPTVTIHCFTASPTSRSESKTLNLIVYEEAQDIQDKKIDITIAPMGASTNATEVFIGTAGYKRCRFWEHISNAEDINKIIAPVDVAISERTEAFRISNNPVFLNYEKHIKKRQKEIGTDSDEYKTQYELVWMLERGQFITFEELEAIEEEHYEYGLDVYGGGITLYGGIDWGKSSDSTIFTVVTSGGKIVYWKEMIGDDYQTQIKVLGEIIKFKFSDALKTVFCDSTGTQDMAVDMLKYELSPLGVSVKGINFTAQSKDFMYKNLSALIRPIIVNGTVIKKPTLRLPRKNSPEKDKFFQQMCDLQKEIKGGLWKVSHPDGAGFRDDFPDSLALACYGIKATKKSRGNFIIA